MTPLDRIALLGIAEPPLAQQLIAEVLRSRRACRLPVASSVAQLRAQLTRHAPAVIVVDESAAEGASLEAAVRELAETAPVVVMLSPERLHEIASLIASGDVDFVARAGDFVPLAASLIERRLRWAERAEAFLAVPPGDAPEEFAEILRHEINNPLTGILGNAEMLLAHRDRLPAAASQRIETIVDLAVRLRETIRRVSMVWESEHHPARTA